MYCRLLLWWGVNGRVGRSPSDSRQVSAASLPYRAREASARAASPSSCTRDFATRFARARIGAFDDLVARRRELPYTVLQSVALHAQLHYRTDTDAALIGALFVMDHPASLHRTRVEVHELIERGEGERSSGRVARLRERAARITLDELVDFSTP